MTVKITLIMSDEDSIKLEQAFKDGRLSALGVSSIEDFKITSVEPKKWADPKLEKRGKLKSDIEPELP